MNTMNIHGNAGNKDVSIIGSAHLVMLLWERFMSRIYLAFEKLVFFSVCRLL